MTPLAEGLTFGHHDSLSRSVGRIGRWSIRSKGGKTNPGQCTGKVVRVNEGQGRWGGGTAGAGLPDRLVSRHAPLLGGIRATPVCAAGADPGSGVAALVRALVLQFSTWLTLPCSKAFGDKRPARCSSG